MYSIAIAPCFVCNRSFGFNPYAVPSFKDERGVKRPVCRDCMDKINELRQKEGSEPFPILPDAYEPADEGF